MDNTNPQQHRSTETTVSSGKPDARTLIVAGQEATAVRQRVEEQAELKRLRIETIELRQDIAKAEAENDRLVTELLQTKTQVKRQHRELWEAVHAVLMKHAPGKVEVDLTDPR